MYAIPIALIVLAALIATAWSPLFALLIAIPLFVAFLAFVGFRPRADEKIEAPQSAAGRRTEESDVPKGAWGEPRP
jgi:hypothetical protein